MHKKISTNSGHLQLALAAWLWLRVCDRALDVFDKLLGLIRENPELVEMGLDLLAVVIVIIKMPK